MINHLTGEIIQERGLKNPIIFKDVDGPGEGNSAILDKTERPKEGGIYAYLIGYKYPYKGLPDQKAVESLHILKRQIVYALHNLNKSLAVLLLILSAIPFVRNIIMKFVTDYIYNLENFILHKVFLIDKRYCTCVREIKRVFDKMISGRKGIARKLMIIMRDFVVLVIEFDSAYKFRFQDIMDKARKKELAAGGKRQRNEILRLFKILREREGDKTCDPQTISSKWQIMERYLRIVLIFSKSTRNAIAEFFKEVDLKKIRTDEGDRYFNKLRQDYEFEGKHIAIRIEERKVIDGENWKYFEEIASEFLKKRKSDEAIKYGKNIQSASN